MRITYKSQKLDQQIGPPLSALIERFQQSDIFVMVSFKETFGLVYPEALSQGLPIVYSKNQGFDGFFPDGQVGKSVEPASLRDIEDGILFVANNFNKMVENISKIDLGSIFSWGSIARTYLSCYREILDSYKRTKQ